MLQELHDLLLANKPEDASHDPASCSYCQTPGGERANHTEGGAVTTETKNPADVEALLAEIADLKAKNEALEAARFGSEIDAKVNEAKSELEAQVAELQTQLDVAVLEAQAAKEELAAVTAFLADEVAKAVQAEETARLRGDRVAKVREVASFPDAHYEANADRWAGMEETAFAAYLEDLKAAGAKPAPAGVPTNTALAGARETASAASGSNLMSEVLDLRFSGIDTRTV